MTTDLHELGWRAADFELAGVDGKRYGLAQVRGPKGTVVMFICNHCPYVKAAIGRITADMAALAKLGIGAVAIMPNDTRAYPEDSLANMKAFAAANRFGFPYVIDETQETARAYGAVATPEFFGFNAALELEYRGRLDVGKTTAPPPDAKRELYDAMCQIAATGKGPREQIPTMGCSIKWRY